MKDILERLTAGLICLGLAAVYAAGAPASGRIDGALAEFGVLASMFLLAGLACLHLSLGFRALFGRR